MLVQQPSAGVLVHASYSAAVAFCADQAFLPITAAFSDIVHQAAMRSQRAGVEGLTEKTCAGCRATQVVAKFVANPVTASCAVCP
ncbi:hypothetical protein Ssi02_69380 [Sinosporangium siamense]|uniref:Uncharacterized protein n=1 Tax=Sinosporangium siamense TaxID=1367973 RepID=A0A919VBN6_9ACTN|nr:hypothetical protein Ssi02_69380 [Sinosporangium siamense]